MKMPENKHGIELDGLGRWRLAQGRGQ